MIRRLSTCAALVAALAVSAPAPASAAANCGTIRSSIDGVPARTRVAVLGTSCATARKVANQAIRQAFPEAVKADGRRWRLFDSHATRSTFRASYKWGRAVVGLQVRYS